MGRLPGRRILCPRPVGFAGRWTTSIDSTRPGVSRLARVKARNDAMLNSSEPQNRMRNGSAVFVAALERYLGRDAANNERTGAEALQDMSEGWWKRFKRSDGSSSETSAHDSKAELWASRNRHLLASGERHGCRYAHADTNRRRLRRLYHGNARDINRASKGCPIFSIYYRANFRADSSLENVPPRVVPPQRSHVLDGHPEGCACAALLPRHIQSLAGPFGRDVPRPDRLLPLQGGQSAVAHSGQGCAGRERAAGAGE
jgi:hypothetical protein